MKSRHLLPFALVALLWASSTSSVTAWGAEGHRIVAHIALTLITPEVTQAVQELLGSEDFVTASTWADQVRTQRRDTYNWHFVDIPYSATSYDPARDCKPTGLGDCIIAEPERAQREMTDATLPKVQRAESLKFLIHFMGDLHQPLHCIDNADRGGNDVHITLTGPLSPQSSNLHSAWDSILMSQRGMNEAAYGVFLSAGPVTQTGPIDFAAWALDTHRLAAGVYAYAGFEIGKPPTTPVALDAQYQTNAQKVVDQQLQIAGVRLALVLNRAFGK